MPNATFELPPTEEVNIDGYKIDLSAGALGGQALIYDVGSNSFIATTLEDAYGSISGSFLVGQVAFAADTRLLNGSNNFTFDGYNIAVGGDGYFTGRLIVNNSSAAVSASGTGAIRYNSGHLEFSENGGSWTQFGSGSLAIGSPVTSGSNKSVLFVDSSNNLAQDNSNFNYDSSTKKLTIGGHVSVDGYTIDLSSGAISGQVLTYNGTSFVAQASSGGISGTLTNTKVPYATGSSALADSGMTWDDANKILTITTITGNDGLVVTDGTRTMGLFVTSTAGQLGTTTGQNLQFFTNNQAAQMTLNTSGNFGIGVSPSYKLDVNGDIHISANRLLIDASSAAVSPSGMGALRFNTGTSHLEFSENGGAWTQLGTGGSMSIGSAVTSGTSKSILYVDGSNNLAQDNSNFAWDFTNHRLGLGTNSPGYQLDIRNATSGSQVHIRSNATTDDGMYLLSEASDEGMIIAGASFNGTNWVAKSTQASFFILNQGRIQFYGNTGLTAGNTFTPTIRAEITPTGAFQLSASSASVSASGTGAIRFNTGTNHLEYSENAGSWTQLSSGGAVSSVSNSDSTLTVSPTTGAVVASLNLAHANTWSAKQTFSSHIAIDGYTIDISSGATSGQVLQYNGTSIVTATQYGNGGVVDQATTKELQLTTTSPTTVVTYTPSSNSNFMIYIYYRVVTAPTTITLTVTWSDVTGSQTQTLVNAVSQATGSYTVTPFYINAAASAITVTATAGTANQVYMSADIVQYVGAGVAGAALNTQNTYTKAQNVASSTLSAAAATINTDASLSNVFTVTLTTNGPYTLANPTNLVAGGTYLWVIRQDATGSRTLAYGNLFKFPGGTAPTLTTTANAVDMISAVYDGTQLNCVAQLNFA